MQDSNAKSTYRTTLVFTSVDGFLQAVQQRALGEIGQATLRRITPFEGGMLQRRITFVLLTARDHQRDEVLACPVFLKAGEFMDGNHLCTPAAEWERQTARAEVVQRLLVRRLQSLTTVRVLDATYLIHPDVAIRFATFPVGEESGGDTE